jgi:hypothetical protein
MVGWGKSRKLDRSDLKEVETLEKNVKNIAKIEAKCPVVSIYSLL